MLFINFSKLVKNGNISKLATSHAVLTQITCHNFGTLFRRHDSSHKRFEIKNYQKINRIFYALSIIEFMDTYVPDYKKTKPQRKQ